MSGNSNLAKLKGSAIVFIFSFFVGYWFRNIWLIGGIFRFFTGWSFLAVLVLLGIVIWESIKNAALVRTMPTSIPAQIATRIPAADFQPDSFPVITRALPDFATGLAGITKFSGNSAALVEHLDYLNGLRSSSAAKFAKVHQEYSAAREQLRKQQMVLYRLACIAARLSKKLDARFPVLAANIREVPVAQIPSAPKVPVILTSTTYARRMERLPRGLKQNAYRFYTDPVAMAMATVAVTAITAKTHLSAMKQLSVDHGEVQRSIADARQTTEILGRSYEEILVISRDIRRQSLDLDGLIRRSEPLTRQTEFTDMEKAAMQSLKQYALISARIRAQMEV